MHRHLTGGIRDEDITHIPGIERFTGKPALLIFPFQDYRHPVVDGSHQFVRCCRDERVRSGLFPGRIVPRVIQPGECKTQAALKRDIKRRLPVPFGLPLKKTGRMDKAPVARKKVPE